MNEEIVAMLRHKAFQVRRSIIMTVINNGEGHVGPALSCADIITMLFFWAMKRDENCPENPDNDKFILSAGHKCLALYGVLAERGVIDKKVLDTYNKLGSPLPGHPDMHKLRGVDFSTGSLGHGLGIASGMCKAAKMQGRSNYVYVIMGDGEQAEGTVWEAATFAAFHGLSNLIAFVDRNGLQVRGKTSDIMNTEPLEERYRTIGWNVITVDGHDMAQLCDAVTQAKAQSNRPSVVICNTTKGKGLPFAEGKYQYHHWDPNAGEKMAAIAALRAEAESEGWEY